MRAFGFTLVLIGLFVIYLSYHGKIGAAMSALITGTVPDTTSSSGSGITSAAAATKYGTSGWDVAKAIGQMPGAP